MSHRFPHLPVSADPELLLYIATLRRRIRRVHAIMAPQFDTLVTEAREEQPSNALLRMAVTESGMVTEASPVQSSNRCLVKTGPLRFISRLGIPVPAPLLQKLFAFAKAVPEFCQK